MKNLITLLILMFALTINVKAQFSESFESGIPSGWVVTGNWMHGNSSTMSSQYFPIPAHTSFMAINSDAAGNGPHIMGNITTPSINLSGMASPLLNFQAYFRDLDEGGVDEVANVFASADDGTTWTEIINLGGLSGEWQNINVDLVDYAGQTIKLQFSYDDGTAWNYGFCVDDISVGELLSLDAEILSVSGSFYGIIDHPYSIGGHFFNNGSTTITSIDVTYTIDGQNPVSATIDNLNIPAFSEYKFEHPTPWVPQNEGDFTITVRIDEVNGSIDQNTGNNELDHEVSIYENIIRPNIIDSYSLTIPEYTEIGNSGDQLDKPTDLDFFPALGLFQLWVINERNDNIGGSTVTYYNAGQGNQTSEQKVDAGGWGVHFMSLPTALAFGDNGNWASSPGTYDANHNGGAPFTGPTLWSSDPAIYAQTGTGPLGSHLDMLHGSPYAMGIAHEVGNAYWVFDGDHENIAYYNFNEDHGPGNDDHADGEIRRYTEIKVKKDGDVPSHLILDKPTGWLYVVDNGNDRVLRIDINSRSVTNASLPQVYETLAVHAAMIADWEVIIDSGLDRPCGIEVMENRLLVSDYATGDIIVYDMDNDFAEMYRIETGEPGITGIKIGPEGNIWYTNRTNNTVMMVTPGEPVSVNNLEEIFPISISPNPTSGLININLSGNTAGDLSYKVMNTTGQLIKQGQFSDSFALLDLSAYQNGMYFISIFNETHTTTKKIVLNK